MNPIEVQMQSPNTSFPSNPSQCRETGGRQGGSDDNGNYFADEVVGDEDVCDDDVDDDNDDDDDHDNDHDNDHDDDEDDDDYDYDYAVGCGLMARLDYLVGDDDDDNDDEEGDGDDDDEAPVQQSA